jgi:hypothetical protein
MSSWRSSVAGRPSQRTGERHVAGPGIASLGAWRGSMGGWACARGLGPRTCPRFQPLARAPTPVSVRFSSWLARNPPKCARTYPQFVAFRAHFPLFSSVFDLPRRTSPGFMSASRNSGRNRPQVREQMAERRHKCASSTHIPWFPASGMAERRHMCASGTHIPRILASGMAGNGHRCASLTHMSPVPSIGMAGNRGMCAAAWLSWLDRRSVCSGVVEARRSGCNKPA